MDINRVPPVPPRISPIQSKLLGKTRLWFQLDNKSKNYKIKDLKDKNYIKPILIGFGQNTRMQYWTKIECVQNLPIQHTVNSG